MKNPRKIILTLSVAAILLQVSCSKNEKTIAPVKTVAVTSNIGKQIALDLYHSLSSGVNTSAAFKTNSAGSGKVTMDNSNPCGSVVRGSTNKTVVSGDTSRTYVGNSLFTYMCNGYFNNNYNVDAYTLVDTLKTTETGSGFANVYNTTLNYVVKSLDAGYSHISIGGPTTTSSYTSRVKGNITTEYHKFSTAYLAHDVAAARTLGNPVYVLGAVDFNTTIIDKDASTNNIESTSSYSGYILFLPDNTAKAYFSNKNGSYTVFLINFLTGQVTAL